MGNNFQFEHEQRGREVDDQIFFKRADLETLKRATELFFHLGNTFPEEPPENKFYRPPQTTFGRGKDDIPVRNFSASPTFSHSGKKRK